MPAHVEVVVVHDVLAVQRDDKLVGVMLGTPRGWVARELGNELGTDTDALRLARRVFEEGGG